MHRDHDLTLTPLFMLVSVKAAAVLGQPFPKCGTFHCFVPVYQDLDCIEPGSASLENLGIMRNSRTLPLICLKQLNELKAADAVIGRRMSALKGQADITNRSHHVCC
jgi:hypothetical protein